MESGLCSARRGVGLFVRSLPNRKLTLLTSSTSPKPADDAYGWIETRMAERLSAESIEIDRVHTTADDPSYGPSLDRVRSLGRAVVTMGCNHEPHLKAVDDLHRPTLCIGHAPNRAQVSSIVPNSFRAGYLAARHLIKSGARRIAYVGRVRRIRQVSLPEVESLKELAGVQAAFIEEGMNLRQELIFPEMGVVAERMASVKDAPDAVVMPDAEGVETIQCLKALGNVINRVVIGDDSLLDKPKRPTVVVFRREEVAKLASQKSCASSLKNAAAPAPSWSTPNLSSKAKTSPRSLSGIALHGVQLALFGLFFIQNPRLGSPSSRTFTKKQPQNCLRWTW